MLGTLYRLMKRYSDDLREMKMPGASNFSADSTKPF